MAAPAMDSTATKPRRNFWRSLLLFLAILGPGIITGSVDNDAGGITTYSVAGAQYGYQLLWTLIPGFIVLFVVMEMNARMGVVTGKGLADLIRENAGVKITFFIFIGLLFTNILNTATEFAGVAGSMQIFGVNKYLSVPLVAVAIWFFAVKGTYKLVERIFLVFSFCLLSYIVSALLGKPDWGEIGVAMVAPKVQFDFAYISIVLGLIGTTICPWMQFYMQSSVIEKGLRVEDYKFTRLDVLFGSLATVVVAFFIVIACASTLYVHGVEITEAKDAALALEPLAGALAGQIFAFALFVASVFSAVVLPVATAFYVCEAFGYEAGLDKKWKEAPHFYWLYTIIIGIGVIIVLIPNAPLIAITIWTQIINGILLPVILVAMMLLINNKAIMGKHTNNTFQNIVGWGTSALLTGLSLFMFVLSFIK
jgi:Mn2+/Fe2+ NRAMP family transporter